MRSEIQVMMRSISVLLRSVFCVHSELGDLLDVRSEPWALAPGFVVVDRRAALMLAPRCLDPVPAKCR
ncbi:MAG: hypothetical protein ACYC18_00895 [Gammaproteobacteria bacterium]|nr:hypothetical protein [Gammaproteobacteria bacterium]